MKVARRRSPSPIKAVIIKAATELFFENGFSRTTPHEVCEKADVGTGNLTYYFPTKEHMLSTLVQMMIDYQWKEMENATDEGKSSLLAYCLELTTLVAINEEIPQMQDFLTAAYSHPMTLDLIRANDAEKIKQVFADYTQGWDDERFIETEAIISGIEYGTLMRTAHTVSAERKIEGALNAILLLFGVSEEIRRLKIAKVLAMDYRAIGRRVYTEFKRYVTEANEQALDEILKNTRIRTYK
jgi:AcrR family transcriptional regulator